MNLNKLLAVGRSFVGGKDTPGRFKMTTQNLLPQFGSGRRQIGTGQAPAGGAAAESHELREAARETRPGSVGVAVQGGSVESGAGELSGRGMVEFGKAQAAGGGVAVGQGRTGKSKSIEAVRVVRNDLSDSDLEVVTVQRPRAVSQPQPQPQPEAAAVVVVPPDVPRGVETVEAGGVWRQVVSRVFRDTRVGV